MVPSFDRSNHSCAFQDRLWYFLAIIGVTNTVRGELVEAPTHTLRQAQGERMVRTAISTTRPKVADAIPIPDQLRTPQDLSPDIDVSALP